MAFENITKNVIIKDSTVFNNNCNESKGDIKTVAQCYCGFDMARTEKEAIANAEFIAFCFNLQQRYNISKLEEAVNMLERCNNQMKIDGYVNKTVDQLLTQIKKLPNESNVK